MARPSYVVAAMVSSVIAFQMPVLAQGSSTFFLTLRSTGTGFGDIRTSHRGFDCPANAGLICSVSLNANTRVVVTAAPEANSVLSAWGGACTGSGACEVTMNAHKEVIATVDARPGTNYLTVLTSSLDGMGQGVVASSPVGTACTVSFCTSSFPSSAVVTMVPMPMAGSRLAAWGGACTGTASCRISMDAPRLVTAEFAVEAPETLNFTSLWWVPAEAGWGINLAHQGDTLFATLFTYDATGNPLWLVMPAGRRPGMQFYYAGDLYRTTGPPFDAVPFTPLSAANLAKVGTMSLHFTTYGTRLLYYFEGEWVDKPLQKQVYGSAAADCRSILGDRSASANYQDLWWNPQESGWGINIAHQGDILFATLFTYDETGRDLWLVMSAGLRQSDGSFFGDLYRTKGPPYNSRPFRPIGPADIVTVGTMRLSFSDGNRGSLTYTYNGRTVTKSITRQVFANTLPLCD